MANALDKVVPFPAPVNYEKQSVEVPGTKRPGQTAHYRNSTFGLIDVNTPHALTTLTQAFDIGLALSKDSPCLGHRPLVSKKPLAFADHYVWETYGQIDERRRNVGSALQTWFKDGTLGGGELETVGIWSPNRPEWAIVDWAVVSYQKVCVSLYDTLGKESVEYIINHSHLTVIFANAPHLAELIKLAPRTPHVKMIVSLDDLDPDMKRVLDMWGAANNVLIKELREVEEFGRAHPVAVIPAAVDQIATICYTSGTTGVPKGVILTHSQIAMGIQSHLYGFTLDRTNQPRLMSYLPLAHIYERTTSVAVVTLGGSIGYFTGDPLRLIEDCQILKPNFFPSVPRVLNRIYQSAMAAGDVPGLRGNIFRRAVKTKVERLHQDAVVTHPFWDRLVFRKIQAVLGGNIKLIACGSAPVNPDVLDFLRVAFSCTVWEGYGMTENAAVCCRLMVDDPTSAGTVGPPHPAIELKLIDVPAMKYTAEDRPNPRGEICCRGAVCFSGYYKDEKNTRETIDEEGWLHTGDVGEIDACGRVKIIDRVKNIMKLSQGEYVALEKIENLYMTSPLIAQIFVHGDPLHAYIVAVVVPDPVQLAALVERVTGARVREDDLLKLQALAQEPKVVQAVLALLTAEGKKTLKGFELVKKIHLSMSPFTVENDTLTPTMKIKRKAAYEMYKKELDALYAEPEVSDSARAAL